LAAGTIHHDRATLAARHADPNHSEIRIMHYGTPPSHIADGLIELRRRIGLARIPSSKLDESLNVAVWNIREFGKKARLDASIYYIAEILSNFDLVALVELRDNLADLKRVIDLLGPYWRVVFSDTIADAGGNHERVGYLYDKRMIAFTGLAAEADPPRFKTKTGEYLPRQSWWRAPYLASFRAGNFDFVMITVHIRWGKSEASRRGEIEALADWVEARRKDKYADDTDIIVTGDFNIPSRESPLYKAATKHGLMAPESILALPGTNLAMTETYDQILLHPTNRNRFSDFGGFVDFYQGDWKALYPSAAHRPKTPQSFTYELSDHLPLWVQLNTDIADERLQILSRGHD
jgi:hypothetical protein